MYDNSIEKAIFTACVAEPRDFTEEEKQYILDSAPGCGDCHSNFCAELVFWFKSRLSNDCWTNANVAFIKAISTIPIRDQTKHNNSATVQRVSLDCQQIATILAALRHWQQSTRTVDRLSFPYFHNVEPLNDVAIDVLCEEINASKPLLIDNTRFSNCQTIDWE